MKGAVYDGKVRKEESSNLYKYYEGVRSSSYAARITCCGKSKEQRAGRAGNVCRERVDKHERERVNDMCGRSKEQRAKSRERVDKHECERVSARTAYATG